MSGDQEPWVFRGGLVADLQRLIPVDNGNDLFLYKFPDQPNERFMSVRPYTHSDEDSLYALWTSFTFADWAVEAADVPEALRSVSADCIVGPFLTLCPAFTLLIEDAQDAAITGFVCGAPDSKLFHHNATMCWWSAMAEKYAADAFSDQVLGQFPEQARVCLADCGKRIHGGAVEELGGCPDDVLSQFPATMICCVWPVNPQEYFSLAKRLVTVLFAALRSHGSFGVHTWVQKRNAGVMDFYAKLGFNVVHEDLLTGRCMLGRKF